MCGCVGVRVCVHARECRCDCVRTRALARVRRTRIINSLRPDRLGSSVQHVRFCQVTDKADSNVASPLAPSSDRVLPTEDSM